MTMAGVRVFDYGAPNRRKARGHTARSHRDRHHPSAKVGKGQLALKRADIAFNDMSRCANRRRTGRFDWRAGSLVNDQISEGRPEAALFFVNSPSRH
jgi:hypothetical protein